MVKKLKQTKASESPIGTSMADWSQTLSTFGGLNPTTRTDIQREHARQPTEPDSESELSQALHKASLLVTAYAASTIDHANLRKTALAAVNQAADMIESGHPLPPDAAAWVADTLRNWGSKLPAEPRRKRGRPRSKSPPSILAEMKALYSERKAQGKKRLSKTAALTLIAEMFDMTLENARTVLQRETEATTQRITAEIEARLKRAPN